MVILEGIKIWWGFYDHSLKNLSACSLAANKKIKLVKILSLSYTVYGIVVKVVIKPSTTLQGRLSFIIGHNEVKVYIPRGGVEEEGPGPI